jgi:hypothetical protein
MDWLPRGIDPHGSSNGIDQTDRTPRHFFRHGPPAIMEVERDVIYTGLAEAVGHVCQIWGNARAAVFRVLTGSLQISAQTRQR